MLTTVTNESNLFQMQLMLGQQRLISSSFLGEVFISCPDNADVSFKLAEIFDSLETGNSSSTKLTAHLLDLLTKIVEYL